MPSSVDIWLVMGLQKVQNRGFLGCMDFCLRLVGSHHYTESTAHRVLPYNLRLASLWAGHYILMNGLSWAVDGMNWLKPFCPQLMGVSVDI